MERIAVWGTGICGERVIELLKNDNTRQIVLVADRNDQKQGKIFCGFAVKKTEKIIELAKRGEIDAVVFAFQNKFYKEVTALFRNVKNVKGYIIPRYIQEFRAKYNKDNLIEIDMSKPRCKQFDVNLVDHCNLRCKGCLRFSNLVDKPVFANYNSMIQDWKRMKELFWGVERLKLMGGEPLLNPDLHKYIQAAREIFPDADIMVTTNALLLNESQKELFDIMKYYNCFFDISLYAPMEEKVDKLETLLETYGVWYVLNYTKGDFYKVMSKFPNYDKQKAYDECTAKNCHHLREGKLSVCSRPQYVYIMNQKYGTQIPDWDGVWNIYDLKMDAWELDKKLSAPFEACKYCAPPVSYEWDRADNTNAQMSDWFVD